MRAPLHIIGGLNIGDFIQKLLITKVYSLPIFHLIVLKVQHISCNTGTCALGHCVYISGNALLPMLQLLTK